MSVYDDASLVLIPSGYKASKLYSVVPTSGDGDLSFSRSTTATRVNADGLIETVAINTPRIDFTGGGCGKLLLEPQRTNVHLYSDDFGSAWNSYGSPSFVGGQSDPFGGTDAALFNYPTTGDFYRLLNQTYVGTHTTSFYIKQGTATSFGYVINTPLITATFNTTLGTVTSQINCTATIETYGTDGWYYCTVTGDFETTNSQVRLSQGSVGSTYLAAFQTEAGSYPTSYIPTAGSTVTRNKDEINSTNVNSWSSVEGTLYLKLQSFDNNSYKQFSLYGSSSDNLTVSYTDTANEIRVTMKIAGVTVIFFSYVMTNQLLINKIAITYSSGRVKLYINGVLRGSSTVSYTTSEGLWTKFVNNIGANYNYFYGNLYEMSISKISSTDTQMAALTTL